DTRDAPDPPSSSDERQPSELTERIIAATASALPENVLAEIASGLRKTSGQLKSGQSGATVKRAKRGRAYGAQTGDPSGNDRLNLIETLRAAAPWQPLRRAAVAHSRNGKSVRKDNSSQALPKVLVRRSDFRIYRREERSETLAIFVVDASGSSAVQRLAETKGAIEVMLGESYSRRDHVSVVAVRGRAADVLMPPTRSLTRARRQLAGLPGGGGTPLASGLEQAFAIADHARRRGQQPMVIVLTDGQANIDRTGTPGRRAAEADAHAAAHMLRAVGVPSVLIDTANRAQPRAKAIADAMGARYIAMPRADGAGVAAAARGAMSTSQTTSASGGRG
ncbi:MAG: VWA domain-containing protein, partial [Pseudomonadota bacterium]